MPISQQLYFMSLVGGMAGLICWTLFRIAAIAIHVPSFWYEMLTAAALGGLISGLAVSFGDRFTLGATVRRWILLTTCLGMALSAFGVLSLFVIHSRVFVWAVIGALIGVGLGGRYWRVNRRRTAWAFLGGLVGGGIGGLVFEQLAGSFGGDISDCLAYMLLGFGICFGVTCAPALVHTALLRLVGSESSKVRLKLKLGMTWELQHGDVKIIGSRSPSPLESSYRPDVEIYVPDPGIADKHALVFHRDDAFWIDRHPSIRGVSGSTRFLAVNGSPVASERRIHDGDSLDIGSTTLIFENREEHR